MRPEDYLTMGTAAIGAGVTASLMGLADPMVARGELDPDEGASVLGVLEQTAGLITQGEMADRVAALEKILIEGSI